MAAMIKINLRLQATVGALTGQVGAAQAAAAAANQAAANAQAVATAAGNMDRFRPAAPSKYRNKKKDAEVKQWLPIIEDYLRTAPDADYIRLHRKKPRLPSIRRTRAGLDLNCRPHGGSCRTRTNTCRPALHEPPGTSAVVVRHWPVLGHFSARRETRSCPRSVHAPALLHVPFPSRNYRPIPLAAGSMPESPLFGAAAPAQDGTDPICASAGPKPDFK
jgi:hypothetical protein